MSNYVKTKDFAAADALATGAPAKAIKGTDLGLEFDNIATAIASKLDTTGAANPTGSVGLAAVNGTATTYMRSDAAPALSQAIVPTWTGIHTFSAAPTLSVGANAAGQIKSTVTGGGTAAGLLVTAATPALALQATGGGADSKIWDFVANNTGYLIRTVNDAGGTVRVAMDIERSGVAVSSLTFGNATDAPSVNAFDAAGNSWALGWRDIPQNTQNASYTFVLSDRGKQVFFNGAAGQTYTIPANSVTAFPIGTTIVVVNFTASNLSIAINTDNLFLAGTASSGTRTLAGVSIATLVKVTSTSWFISGVGLS